MQPTIVVRTSPARSQSVPHRSAIQIERWLIDAFARLSQVEAEDIDIDRAFVDYQLDSSVAVSLAKLLGDWCDAELQATIFWEYPNIRELASALAALRRG